MDEWSTKLAEKECIGIPPVVVVSAALKLLAKWVPKCEIITPDMAVKILANEIDLNDDYNWTPKPLLNN